MKQVFADTFYCLALVNRNDAYHEQAVAIPVKGRKVTTQAVLLEVMDALFAPPFRRLASRFWRTIHQDPEVVVVPLDGPLCDRAAAMFEAYQDKQWSMTDCISFLIMWDREITQALTLDRHFQQAGFLTLFGRHSPGDGR